MRVAYRTIMPLRFVTYERKLGIAGGVSRASRWPQSEAILRRDASLTAVPPWLPIMAGVQVDCARDVSGGAEQAQGGGTHMRAMHTSASRGPARNSKEDIVRAVVGLGRGRAYRVFLPPAAA